ncbi:hypothetical protein Baya_10969 [Bagarius yarrelli]|uniref:Uncharacterized protein n=1 Tax=Bagarius yarrelli TaxID=175774 RepID=A0A556UYI6_BAGYA|nr:hypothetical protein Baya_10969 [Bagarius yarrelli]
MRIEWQKEKIDQDELTKETDYLKKQLASERAKILKSNRATRQPCLGVAHAGVAHAEVVLDEDPALPGSSSARLEGLRAT